MSYNKIILLGRLGKDPEIGSTPGGDKFAKFSIATEDQIKIKGEWQKETTWHNITLWNNSANYAEKNLHKGDGILVEGKMKFDNYEAKDGTKKMNPHVVVSLFKKQFLATGGSDQPVGDDLQIADISAE